MASLKLFHLLFVFTWVGSLLSLTRLMGYVQKEEPLVQIRILKLLRRMYLFVDFPSMCLAIVSGICLFIVKGVDFSQGWLHMKLTFVFALVVCDAFTGRAILNGLKGSKQVSKKGPKVLHGCAALSLLALLVSVYIVKNKVSTDSSLAKKEKSDMILPLKTNGNS